eukprot:TRINITY_DN12385_c0_g1_i1.p1 TRINITY_DN12385_c0_g1~~TRINITY_DN12385_c0_g1_i1.p1  ORF type:complete len:478 (-),score=59.89 TRINITY_DN12385_c0_g1_i1:169-1602(-)
MAPCCRSCWSWHSGCMLTLLALACGAEAGYSPSPLQKMQRCAASGKFLDLTHGTPGNPECVSSCEKPAVRSIQAEGVAFCMMPLTRGEPLDIVFTLMLHNVSWRDVPSVSAIRIQLPMAVGQALQVAPGDVIGEMMVRDRNIYSGFELVAFELHRKEAAEAEGLFGRPRESRDKEEIEQFQKKPKDRFGRPIQLPKAEDLVGNSTIDFNGTQSNKAININQALRLKRQRQKPPPSGFLGRPRNSGFQFCSSCDVYVAMRCEAWRIGRSGSRALENQLLKAFAQNSQAELSRLLGLDAPWKVLKFSTALRPRDLPPLESVGAEPAFRYKDHPWNFDPIDGNFTREGDLFHELGLDKDDSLKFGFSGLGPDNADIRQGSVEILLIGLIILLMLFVAIQQQQMAMATRPPTTMIDRNMLELAMTERSNRILKTLTEHRLALAGSLQSPGRSPAAKSLARLSETLRMQDRRPPRGPQRGRF